MVQVVGRLEQDDHDDLDLVAAGEVAPAAVVRVAVAVPHQDVALLVPQQPPVKHSMQISGVQIPVG